MSLSKGIANFASLRLQWGRLQALRLNVTLYMCKQATFKRKLMFKCLWQKESEIKHLKECLVKKSYK